MEICGIAHFVVPRKTRGLQLAKNTNLKKDYSLNKNKIPVTAVNKNNFYTKNGLNLTFEGKPICIPYDYCNSAKDTIRIFDYLKNGSYLDSSDDISPQNYNIRKNNLSFLDKLDSQADKSTFVNYYKNLTGFPNLQTVSKNIETEFIKSIENIENKHGSSYQCIAAGYDESCSVGKGLAFPGSDLDKAYIVVKGTNNDDENIRIVNEIKKNLWKNTDQRILSFNHDTSFPNIYTEKQIFDLLKKIQNSSNELEFDKNEILELKQTECFNLEKAGKYNILLAKTLPNFVDFRNPVSLNKNNIKNFAFFIEALRDGKCLKHSNSFSQFKEKLNEYDFYNYSNVAHLCATKKISSESGNEKDKIKLRKVLQNEFNNYDINFQYAFISELIRYSCEDNKKYPAYFTNNIDMKNLYKRFLSLLVCDDANILYEPVFSNDYNSLVMQYKETGEKVHLYNGFTKNILWIDSNDADAIKSAERQFYKIKNHDRFSDINTIECPKPNKCIVSFQSTNFYTASGEQIYIKYVE